jgi:hypothetical protein
MNEINTALKNGRISKIVLNNGDVYGVSGIIGIHP